MGLPKRGPGGADLLRVLLLLFGLAVYALALVLWSNAIPDRTVQAHPASIHPSTVAHIWTRADSLAYANDRMQVFAGKEFRCLVDLWEHESGWDSKAYNPVKVMGRNAGGIPQLLGLSPLTPPPEQIDRGFAYIQYRYMTACRAWGHFKSKGWY